MLKLDANAPANAVVLPLFNLISFGKQREGMRKRGVYGLRTVEAGRRERWREREIGSECVLAYSIA